MKEFRNARGGAVLEAALFVPVLLALLIGTVDLARIAYTYYTLEKIMYDVARYAGTQQGVNFCNGADPTVQAAIDNSIVDPEGNPIVPGLTADMFQIQIERYDPVAQALAVCDCSATGCDASQAGLPPDFIVVSLTNGYSVQPVFWGFTAQPFPLRPSVMVPYGGT
jgi:hypothetical protein